jgi:ribosomal protein S18 acetylase RimI-like enzyme
MRLSVAEQNEGGMRFWTRQGYRVEKRFPPRRMGERDTVLLELKRELT